MATSTKLRSFQYSRRSWSSTVIAEQDIALGCAGLTERQGWGNAKDGQIFLSECWLRFDKDALFWYMERYLETNSVREWQVTFTKQSSGYFMVTISSSIYNTRKFIFLFDLLNEFEEAVNIWICFSLVFQRKGGNVSHSNYCHGQILCAL